MKRSHPISSIDRQRSEDDGMTESDTDTQIKRYWASRERLMRQEFLQKLEELHGFRDAAEDSPVRTAEFIGYLDLEPVERFLDGLYGRKPTYPAKAMVKSLFLMDLRRMKFRTELERDLDSHPEEARMLGFPVEDGHVLVTTAKNLWHFDRIRMGRKWDDLFRLLCDAVVREAASLGLVLGEKTLEDATPIEALDGDSEAEYNGHYEVKGYKLDTVTDLEEAVPLNKKVTGINDDEAKNLQPQMSEMKEAGIDVRDLWIDGGYADYVNLAWMGVNGIGAHYHLHENWVRNEKGSIDNILRLYQEHWKDGGFKQRAGIGHILSFLLERGHVEEVGAFFRNQAMDRYAEDPVAFLDDYHKRSRQEGSHGYWKEHLDLERRLRTKGLVNVDRYLTRNLCAVLAVALCRLQHGIKENLTSVAYLT